VGGSRLFGAAARVTVLWEHIRRADRAAARQHVRLALSTFFPVVDPPPPPKSVWSFVLLAAATAASAVPVLLASWVILRDPTPSRLWDCLPCVPFVLLSAVGVPLFVRGRHRDSITYHRKIDG
jgi:hypothetical protein